MTIRFYDLAGADEAVRFSPHCWKTRFALLHKGLDFTALPWRFTEKDEIAFSGQGTVPVIVDGEKTLSDSWKIALYLEETYPDRPSLFGGETGKGAALFFNNFADTVLAGRIAACVLTDIYAALHEKDKDYFRQTREARFGCRLEEFVANPQEKLANLNQSLTPLRATLDKQAYLGGDQPFYGDYCVFAMFQWARCVGAGADSLLEADDPLNNWIERLSNAFNGEAAGAAVAAKAAA